jgi:hypothetical protein
MLPTWLGFDTLMGVTVGLVAVASFVGILVLFLVRAWAVKIILILVFVGVGVGAWTYRVYLEDQRHDNCSKIELFGYGVPVPHCPKA